MSLLSGLLFFALLASLIPATAAETPKRGGVLTFAVTHTQLDVSQQKATIANGDFTVALDAFCAGSDDPKPLLLPYLSKSPSPRNMTRSETPEFDALYDTFKSATAEAQGKRVATATQRMVIEAANSVPVLWYSRIAHVSTMTGWKIIPTHFANQDLADVWLDQ